MKATIRTRSNVRNFFHFPDADLFINLRVPRAAQLVALCGCLDLGADFPRSPPLYRENFVPWAVPLSNTVRTLSRPIEVDGTKDTYPIRYPFDDYSFVLHRSFGVSRITSDGLERLHAATLNSIKAGLRDRRAQRSGRAGAYALLLQMPEAFAQSQQLVVDASWFQPEFASHAIGPIEARLWDRAVPGLLWDTVGQVRAR